MTQRLSDSPFPLQHRLDTETLAKPDRLLKQSSIIYGRLARLAGVAPKITNIFSS